jgi:hypothetical protein
MERHLCDKVYCMADVLFMLALVAAALCLLVGIVGLMNPNDAWPSAFDWAWRWLVIAILLSIYDRSFRST